MTGIIQRTSIGTMPSTKPLSIASEFKRTALPRFGDYGFIEYAAKRFGALSSDGILVSVLLRVETTDIKRFAIELAACSIHEAHDHLPLTVGGKFPDFANGDTYNARDAEILARSLAYVIQHLEKGTKDWIRRIFSLPGYLAELRSLKKTHPYLWKTGHIQFSIGVGELRLGQKNEALSFFQQAKDQFAEVCAGNALARWAKDGEEKCSAYLTLASNGTSEEILAKLNANREHTTKSLALQKLTDGQ